MVFSLAGCHVQIDPRDIQPSWPPPDPNSPLIGTLWEGGGAGGSVATLRFVSAETVIYSEDAAVEQLNYFYNKETRRGRVPSLGDFTRTENTMNFSRWRSFPCEANFTRIE